MADCIYLEIVARGIHPSRSATKRRVARRVGELLILIGAGCMIWAGVVWKWNDPVTSVYTRWKQHELGESYREVVRAAPKLASDRPTPPAEAARWVGAAAQRLRARADTGDPIGRIRVPRLGLDMFVVNGTTTAVLKRGPGRDPRTFMPGQNELVYIAGHRTTYQAPFAKIDALRKGDRVTLEMPYASFVYRVTSHVIVDASNLSVLRSKHREELALQACHPRFFATDRYIVWAKPLTVTPRGGRTYRASSVS